MNHVKFISKALYESIQASWNKITIPSELNLCKVDINTICFDSNEISDWLLGKSYLDLYSGNNIESYMPFFYLKKNAALYYIGGYIIYSLQEIFSEPKQLKNLFGFDHLIDFIISNRFEEVFLSMNKKQQRIVLAFVELVLVIHQEIEMDEDVVRRLKSLLLLFGSLLGSVKMNPRANQ